MTETNQTHDPVSYVVDSSSGALHFVSLGITCTATREDFINDAVVNHLKTYVEASQPIPVDTPSGNGLRYFIAEETSRYIHKYNDQFNKKEPVDQVLIDAMKGESS